MKCFLFFIALAIASFAQTSPNLSKVYIETKARPLTNCVVKKVTANGITFMCDQGMIQVPFKDLPAEFAYYRNTVVEEPKVVIAPATPVPSISTPKTTTKTASKVKSELELAEEAKKRADQRDHLNSVIAKSEALIAKYERQSLIGNKNPVSTEDYNLAKARVNDAKAKLAALN